jgi:hypothetical protein
MLEKLFRRKPPGRPTAFPEPFPRAPMPALP